MAMVESYRVGAVLELRDEASPAMKRLFENAERLEKLFRNVQKAISGINEIRLGGFTEKLGGISEKLTGITTKAEGLGAAVTRSLQNVDNAFTESGRKITGFSNSFDAIPEASRLAIEGVTRNLGLADTAIGASTEAAGRLATALREAGAASRDIPRLPRAGGGGGGSGGDSHPRPGQGGHGDHSRIQTTHGERPNATGAHGAFIDAGIFGMIGSHEVAASVEATLHRGMELAHVQQQMLEAGMSQDEVGTATKGAWTEARRYGLDVSKVMEDIKELRFPFGSTEHAINFIDPLEQMRVVLNSVTAGSGNGAADSVYEMARAGELKGLQSPQEFLTYFDDMTKVISATGGKVTPKDFMQAMKYGRVASMGWDEEFTTKYLPTLMQSLGPSGGGTAAMSLFGTLAQGKVGKRALGQMEDLGLIGDESKIIHDNKGDPVGFNPGAVKDTDEFVRNPALWAQKTLLPLLNAKFGDLGPGHDLERLHAAEGLGGLFGNRMSAQAIAEFILRMQSINKDANLTRDAKGVGSAQDLLRNDPTAAMNNFSAAWTNMMTALGLSSVSTAISTLNSMASGLNRLGELAQAHPDLARNLEGIAGGLAAGLGGLAILGLAAFAPGGLVVAGATALVGAITGFTFVNWDKVKEAASAMGLSMDNFHKNIADISGAFDQINAALTKFFTGLVDAIRKIPVIGGMIPGENSKEVFGPNLPPGYSSKLAPGGANGDAADYGLGGFSPMAYKTTEGMGHLNEKTGLVNIAFATLDKGTLAVNDNFTSLGTGSGAFKTALDILTATAIGAARALAEVAMSGGAGGGGGSGLINASWGGSGGGFGGGSYGGGSLGETGAGAGRRGFGGGSGSSGVNPYAGDSGGGVFVPPAGDHLTAGMRNNNLGNIGWFGQHMAGLLGPSNAHDVDHSIGKFATQEDGIRAAAALALSKYHKGRHSTWDIIAAAGGWTPGALGPGASVNVARAMGLGNRDDVHLDDPEQMVKFLHGLAVQEHGPAGQFYTQERIRAALGHRAPIAGAPPSSRTVAPGKPATAPSIGISRPIQVNLTHVLDGKVLARSVTHHQVAEMEHPNAVGGPDTYGSWQGPATPLNDAA